MRYAEVAVDASIGHSKMLTYSVPRGFPIKTGQLIWVPLGQRLVQGIVFDINDQSNIKNIRDILAVVEPYPLISPAGLRLARWLSRYYMSSLFEAASLMLPPGFKDRVRPYLSVTEHISGDFIPSKDVLKFWLHINQHDDISEKRAKEYLGEDAPRLINSMVNQNLVRRVWRLPRPKNAPRYDGYLGVVNGNDLKGIDNLPETKGIRQRELLQTLIQSEDTQMPLSVARKIYGMTVINSLIRKGVVFQEWNRRDIVQKYPYDNMKKSSVELTSEQEVSLQEISMALDGSSEIGRTFLLYGVTGSGKTEVYLRAIERCIAKGRQAILMVPELSLTPKMVDDLNSRFPGKVGLVHSGLSSREKFDFWWMAREGAYDVVLGPRSALFSPLRKLGLIIIDEEHELAYKEEENPPHYHVRDVAVKLAEGLGTVVVMGSATPDVCTFYRASRGHHVLHKLSYRVGQTYESSESQVTDKGLATTEIVDMRDELKRGNLSCISEPLVKAITYAVSMEEQVVIFLNRRGTAHLVQCRDCGLVVRCKKCFASMTFHRSSGNLICHHCNKRSASPTVCPVCHSKRIRYVGLGTEKVVEDIEQFLPNANILRWDRDTAINADAHRTFLESFSSGESQILVGTQMIAKGLHIPNVSLVGVILADVGLNVPDFRAFEHTFQVLCQVAGRAGRGNTPGKVIIQTYSPSNYAIRAASDQDYQVLYDKEIDYRWQQRNPPFSRLIRMTYFHSDAKKCEREASRLARVLRSICKSRSVEDLDIIGPAPAYPEMVRGRIRWNLIIRGRDPHYLLDQIQLPRGWILDVDPSRVF